MTCGELERWLDDGGAPDRYLEAMAHARICAHCSAALGALDGLETMLAERPVAAPPGFTARVMAAVASTPQVPARIPVTELMPFFQTVPWWVRLAIEPASVLALLLASVLLWRGDTLFALASTGAVHLAAWLTQAMPAAGAVSAPGPTDAIWLQPLVLTCIAVGMAPIAIMASRLLYRWSASLAGPHRPWRSLTVR